MAGAQWSGLAELRAALRQLPADLTGEGAHIIEGVANAGAREVRTAYGAHVVTGRLQAGVNVTLFDRSQFSGGAMVRSAAPHATIFERGTKARRNARGANRGAMPAANTFIPAMQQHRRDMYQRLAALVERHGLRVTGGG